MKTQWEGLWKNRQGVYSGKVVNTADLPEKVRVIVRYNKYYESDTSRPRFVYCFADGAEAEAITMSEDSYRSIMDKINDLAETMRAGQDNADVMMLPSESQERAAYLQEKALSLIEEITGEKWEFSYLTW